MMNPTTKFKAKTTGDVKRLIQKADSYAAQQVRADLLSLIIDNNDWQISAAKAERQKTYQAARQVIKDTFEAWSDSGKMNRLAEVDPGMHSLFSKTVKHVESLDSTISEAELWNRMR